MTAVSDVGRTPPHSRAAARRIDAYLLSSDDGFTLEIGQVMGERLRSRPIDSPEELPDHAVAPWLLLLDASLPRARVLLSSVERRFPHAAVIAIVPDNEQSQWLGDVARGSVSAIIGRSLLTVDTFRDALAAAERRLQLTPAAPATSAAQATPATPSSGAPDRTASSRIVHGHGPPAAPQRAVRRYGLAAIAAVVVAITGWLLFGQHAATPNREGPGTANAPAATGTATPRAAARPAVPQRTVLETLSLARIAFRDQSRLLPRFDAGRDGQRGDSALELYAEVLAQDARNDEARDGVARLSNAVQTRLQADLAAGRMDEAALLIAAYKAAGADPAQILKFEADIRAAQPKWLASQAQQAISTGDLATADQALTQAAASGADRKLVQDLRHALESRQQELQLQQLAGEVHAAIAAGNLLDPAVGNARTKLLAMRQLNRNHAATLAAQRELQSVLLERAREQQQSGQFDAALLWNSAAAELASTDETTEQRRRIRADQELQAAHSAAVVAAAAAAPAAPAAPSAPAVAKPSYLKATPSRPLDAHYPQILTGSKITGTVVVEFTLQADGSASDATIVEATAPGVFDRAATAAVARGRFDVSVLGASRQPQRARIKLNFQP